MTSFWNILRRRGPEYFVYLLTGVFVPAMVYRLLKSRWRPLIRPAIAACGAAVGLVAAILAGVLYEWVAIAACVIVITVLVVGARLAIRRGRRNARRRRALAAAHAPGDSSITFTEWMSVPLADDVRRLIARQLEHGASELVLGELDKDGRLKPVFGEVPGLPCVSPEEFRPRKRFVIDVVLWGGRHLLIRKNYCGDCDRFLEEWLTLSALTGRANVPALHHVDEARLVLYRDLVLGKTVRELLVDNGAKILHAQTDSDPALEGLDKAARLHTIVSRGTAIVPLALQPSFVDSMVDQVERMHRAGVTGVSNTFGNIVSDAGTGEPVFIDLEGATVHRSTQTAHFAFRRDEDREKLRRRYGIELMTEGTAREELASQLAKSPAWYAPIDFGHGLTIGGFWSSDSGTGRWDFINGPCLRPLLPGKRVLDLGSNNGLMPLMMLRAGAREVVGLELSTNYVEAADLIKRTFEWRDMRHYALTIHHSNMLDILNPKWSDFDVVTSFCSLYYLEPEDMVRVVRRAAELAPVMVIQANVATRKAAAARKSEKASLEFMQSLLESNGFPRVEVTAPKGFSRPLLIGFSK